MAEEPTKSPKTFEVTNLTMPIATAIALVGFVFWGTTQLYGERDRIDKKIDQLAVSLESLANSLRDLGESIIVRSADRWTKTDMQVWCLKAEKDNHQFRCPAAESTTPPEKSAEIGRTLVREANRAKIKRAPVAPPDTTGSIDETYKVKWPWSSP